MNKRKILIGEGVWLFILAALGVPSGWKTILLIITGLSLIAAAFTGPQKKAAGQRKSADTFVENGERDKDKQSQSE